MTHHSLYRLVGLISLIFSPLLATSAAHVQAASPVTVRLAPASVLVPLGQTADVAVEVVDVQDLYGFDVALTFDPGVVEVVDADPDQLGVQIASGTFLDSGFVVLNQVDNATGTLRLAMTQLNPSPPKSGTGTLIVIRLQGKQVSGGTPLMLTNVQLAKRDGTSLTTSLFSGQVSVVAAAGSAPANTLIPTSTPLSIPATAAPATGSATVQPTLTPLVTGLAATITPRPTDQPVTTTPGALTRSPTASSATNPLPGSVRASETPQPTSVSSAPLTTKATSTPAAVAAVAAPSDTPAGVQAAIRVTESATSVAGSPGSSIALLLLSGALGLVGFIAVLWIIRRRPS